MRSALRRVWSTADSGRRGDTGEPSPLVEIMTFDWTMRSLVAGIVGIFGCVASVFLGAYGFAVLFALIALAGWGIFLYFVQNPPSGS